MSAPSSYDSYLCTLYELNCPPPPPSSDSYEYDSPPPPSSSSSSSSSKLSSAAVGGIVVAVIVFLIILVVILVVLLCCCRKKNIKNNTNNSYGNIAAQNQNNSNYNPTPGSAQAILSPAAAPSTSPSPDIIPPKGGDYYYNDGSKLQWQKNNPPPPVPVVEQHYNVSPTNFPSHPQAPAPAPAPRPFSAELHPTTPSAPISSIGYSSSGPPTTTSTAESDNVGVTPKKKKQGLGFSINIFTYEELSEATDGFSESHLLGQGGFGYVYKGLLSDGTQVAVKTLRAGSSQGDTQFEAEIETVSRVHHKHLVSLLGYCISDTNRLLVYEFVPNGTMHFHLHAKGVPTMSWATRMKIALGSAKGLAYLHEDCRPKIIHRDIKAANILLDFEFEAKVADFGLAKFTSDQNTHVSTRVMGTFGYLAPEYASSGKLTEKSDVYSFGVMLLELITGQLPHDVSAYGMDDSLVDWAIPLLTRAREDGNFDSLVDPKLENKYDHNEMVSMAACAAASVRHSARQRPKMSKIVRALEGNLSLADLNEGVTPGHSSAYSPYPGSDYDSGQYKEDLKRFRQMVAMGTQDSGGMSSEYGGAYPSGSSSGGGQPSHEMEMGKFKNDSGGSKTR